MKNTDELKNKYQGDSIPQERPEEKQEQGSLNPQERPEEKQEQGSLNPQERPQARPEEQQEQGSLNPQEGPEEKQQGSLNPQEAPDENRGQGSLNPQEAPEGKRGQGSLNPQETPEGKRGQGSLNPQEAPEGKRGQGSLNPQEAPDEKRAQGSLNPQEAPDEKRAQGSLNPQEVPQTAPPAGHKSEDGAAPQAVPTVGKSPEDGAAPQAVPTVDKSPEGGAAPQAAPTAGESPEGGAAPQAAPAAENATSAVLPPQTVPPTGNRPESGTLPQAVPSAGNKAEAGVVPASEPGSSGSGNVTGKTGSRSGRKAFWISLLLILLLIGGVYAAGYKYCETHFMPGSSINGFDCAGLTEEEAEARFAGAARNYGLNIRFRGGSTEVLKADDIGFAFKSDGSIGAFLHSQDQLMWPKYFFEDHEYTMEVGGLYDPDLLTKALSVLPELQKENMKQPENAYIRFRDGSETEDGAFEIVPDDPGSTIDIDQLAAGAGDAAARYEADIDAEKIAGAYQEAEIKADNAELVVRCRDLNELVGASITYVMPDGGTIRLNSDVMKDWLQKDEKGRLVKDDEVWDEKLWEFLEYLARNCNTLGMDRKFKTTERGVITVSGGDYGNMVDQIEEHALLLKDLPAGKKETRKPAYHITPYNYETENDGIGTTYIEVDLTAQHVWCYVKGKLVMECDCVSGDPTTKHETPTGVFGIMFMKKEATLRGIMQKNGKYEYETKVKYWMPFYAECGFHDAWWRTAFGEEIYKGDGSHGCINLSSQAAEELFSYCDEKMPVVIYK